MKRLAAVALIALAFLGACKEKDKETQAVGSPCGSAPAAMASAPTLPTGFPTPDQVTYTSSNPAGPSTIVEGYWAGDLTEAFDGYKSAFGTAGYQITKEEKDVADAEVAFAGGQSTGQVKLRVECEGRTSVTITIRPD